MPFKEVRPGDVISSAILNDLGRWLTELQARLDALPTGTAPGGTSVPRVFGRPLSAARSTLQAAGLGVDRVFLPDGTEVAPTARARQASVVLGQQPGAGTRIAPGTFVGLVIAPTTAPPPTIDEIEPASSAAGAIVTLSGNNFSGDTGTVTVTFNGTSGVVSLVGIRKIRVTIPESFPDVPAGPDSQTPVTVRLQTPTGEATFPNYPVAGPQTSTPPTLGDITAVGGGFVPGGGIVITGQNLSSVDAVRFELGDFVEDVTPDDVQADSLEVTAPDDGLRAELANVSFGFVTISLLVAGLAVDQETKPFSQG